MKSKYVWLGKGCIMEFNECLSRIRKEKGMTQDELAEKVGVSRQSVSKWELGESLPDIEKMTRVADVFNVSLDTLCGRSTDSSDNDYNELFNKEPITKEKKTNNIVVFVCSFIITFALCMAFFALGNAKGKNQAKDSTKDTNSSLPEIINVQLGSNERISANEFRQSFVPSYASKDAEYVVSYGIINSSSEETIKKVKTTCEYNSGKCYFTFKLEDNQKIDEIVFTVTVGNESRNVIIMRDVDSSGYSHP